MRGCPIPRCPTAQLDCLIEPQLRNPGPPRPGVLSLRPSVSPAEPCSRLIRAPTLREERVRGRGILRKYLFFSQLGEPLVHRWLAFSQQRCVHPVGGHVQEDRGDNLGSGIRDAGCCFGTRCANGPRNRSRY
jgi:hypothetical protein